MPYFHPYYFENLKTQILKIAGFTNLIPANCRTISLLIENKTRQKISETTLKRVFGFAFSKFQPSLFTLDVMARFCEYRSWNDFCENQEDQTTQLSQAEVTKSSLSQNAAKITQFTLQALKNKSGIPYYQTINRKFIDDHFNLFLNGDYNATILAAPAGYGKTIALCHWVEDRLAQRNAKVNDDNILFFSLAALMNVFFTGRDLNEWLLALLGYSTDQDVTSFLEAKKKNKGYFILIIDGLDDYTFKNDQFQLLLNQIMDIFSCYQNYPWFKLVLTMRTATVNNYSYFFENTQPRWFKGFVNQEDKITNVPLFNISEIKRLCSKINPGVNHIVDIDVVKKINYPLYFQFSYKNQKDDFNLKKLDQLHMYEVIATFILNKIYLGPGSSEKVLLINAFCQKMDIKGKTYAINKLSVDSEIKQYKYAYQELLGIGYIKEINTSTNLRYETLIHFGNDDFLAYTIAKQLLDKNTQIFGRELLDSLCHDFNKSPVKLLVLRWCIIYALKSGQTIDFELLHNCELSSAEKLDTIIFLGDLFKKELSASRNSEMANLHYMADYSSGIFNHFLGLQFICPEYKKALQGLLSFGLFNREKILLYTSLALIAVNELDLNQLEEQLLNLKRFNTEDYQTFPVNPYLCLETIYFYLKHGVITQEVSTSLTRLNLNSAANRKTSGYSKESDQMLLLLDAYTLYICKKPEELKKFNAVVHGVSKTIQKLHQPFNFLLNSLVDDTWLTLKDEDNFLTLYHQLYEVFQDHKMEYTPFMRASFYLLQLRVSIHVGKFNDIFKRIQALITLAEQHNFKLIKLFCLVYVLENRKSLKINSDFYKVVNNDFIKTIRESGFRGESFWNSGDLMANIS